MNVEKCDLKNAQIGLKTQKNNFLTPALGLGVLSFGFDTKIYKKKLLASNY